MEFFKFPRTPHLFLLPGVDVRDDKVMDSEEVREFLSHSVFIEEKVDGANLGISLHESGEVKIQNRGNYIQFDTHPQFGPLKDWIYQRIEPFQKNLGTQFILFGEWCYLKHSIHYTGLPDWFIGFDVYDKGSGRFLSFEKRNTLLDKCGIEKIPMLFSGKVTRKDLAKLVGTDSAFYPGPVEGLYLRMEENGFLKQRAKLVRPEFIQAQEVHWSKMKLVQNQLG